MPTVSSPTSSPRFRFRVNDCSVLPSRDGSRDMRAAKPLRASRLTPRSIALLIAGFAFLIPGFWDPRLSYAMLAWDVLVLLAALLDGMRLPRADRVDGYREAGRMRPRLIARPRSN